MDLHNLEAEKAVLGGLINDNTLIQKHSGKLKPEFFYFRATRELFDGILKAYEKHGIVDLPTLSEFDIQFVVDIIKSHVTTANWRQHCKIIFDLSVRRQILRSCEKIRNIAENKEIESIELVKSQALQVLNDISLPEQRDTAIKINEIALQALSNLEKKYKQGESAYLSWKLKWLQEKTGGIKSEYTILAARPSVGKTALALQIALKVAMQGAKVLIFSTEMMSESIYNRLICNYANINKDFFDQPHLLTDKIYAEIQFQSARLAQLPIKIYDSVFSIEEIVLKCEEAKATDGLDFVVIDYIQLIETSKRTQNSNEKISYISRTIKKLQQKSNIHVLALSQLNRESERNEWPVISNLRDSGSLEQDANNVFMLHPEQKDEEQLYQDVWLIIGKQREGERNIKTKIKFYGTTQRFFDS